MKIDPDLTVSRRFSSIFRFGRQDRLLGRSHALPKHSACFVPPIYSMPTISERQELIRAILLASENELRFALGMEDDTDLDSDSDDPLFHDLDMDSDGESSSSSDSSTSSSSSSSSSSSGSSEGSVESSDSMDSQDRQFSAMASYTTLLQDVLGNRTLYRNTVAKCSQLYLVLVDFKNHDHKRFRRNLRVLPSTFDGLVAAIEDHPVFENNSNRKQFPVEIQLAIALFRFGHDGNATSVESVAQWAGVSVGLVVKSTRRIMIAFLSMHDTVVRWPSADEKEAAKEWVEAVSCEAWRGGFCMVDGTLIPLFEKPGHHGEAYFDRKSNYSMNVQVRKIVLAYLINMLIH